MTPSAFSQVSTHGASWRDDAIRMQVRANFPLRATVSHYFSTFSRGEALLVRPCAIHICITLMIDYATDMATLIISLMIWCFTSRYDRLTIITLAILATSCHGILILPIKILRQGALAFAAI